MWDVYLIRVPSESFFTNSRTFIGRAAKGSGVVHGSNQTPVEEDIMMYQQIIWQRTQFVSQRFTI